MSEIEKINLYNNLRPFLKKENEQEVQKMLGLNLETLEQRLTGLKKEHELFLILNFLQSCNHMLAFDEGVSKLTKSYQPDMLIELKNNEKMFLEIKSTEKTIYKISMGNLSKKMDFAKTFGFPLYFVIKIKPGWVLYSSEKLKLKSGKIEFDKDFIESEFNEKFDNLSYIFPVGIKIVQEFSKSLPSIAYNNKKYGQLISYKLFYLDNLIFEINSPEDKHGIFLFLLKFLNEQLTMSDNCQVDFLSEDRTLVTGISTFPRMTYEYLIFLKFFEQIIDKKGGTHDSTSFLKSILGDKEDTYPKAFVVRNMMAFFQSKGLPIIAFR